MLKLNNNIYKKKKNIITIGNMYIFFIYIYLPTYLKSKRHKLSHNDFMVTGNVKQADKYVTKIDFYLLIEKSTENI